MRDLYGASGYRLMDDVVRALALFCAVMVGLSVLLLSFLEIQTFAVLDQWIQTG
jgi:hypothetical protein